MRPKPLLLVAALSVMCAASAPGQTSADSLPSGARIRLRAPDAGIPWMTTGVLDSLARDTAYVRNLKDPPGARGARLAVPLQRVEALDVSEGRRSRWPQARRGALWGLALYGAFAGTVIVHERRTCHGPDCFGEGMAWIGLAGGVPMAAGLGASVGFALPVERWRAVRWRRE